MSVNIQTSFVQQYTTNVELLLQQKGSKLRDTVQIQPCVGKAAVAVDQFGSVSPVRDLPRHADTPLISVPQDRRWVYPHSYVWADLIDDEDKLRTIYDPTNPYATAGAAGMGRGMDDEIISGFLNANLTGETGSNSTGLLSAYGSGSQVIAATVGGGSSNVGLNVAKLREAKRILLAAEVDPDQEELWMLISSRQHDNLLAEIQIASKEYNETPVLVNGQVTQFMGFKFKVTERIPGAARFNTTINSSVSGYTTGTIWLCPFYAKSGVTLGMWNDINSSFDKRSDKNNSTQVLVKGTFGATRNEELKCGLVTCY